MAAPTITGYSPATILAGGPAFILTVLGAGFDSSIVLSFASSPIATTFVDSSHATATVPAALIASVGSYPLTATTTGGTSAVFPVLVTSALDLVTVSAVKSWLSGTGATSVNNTSDDTNIQRVITAAGLEWLWRTGNGPSDGSVPLTSPFVEPVAFNEWYDGTNSARMFLRHAPITSVTVLTINGLALPQSSKFGAAGFVIHQDGRSLAIRSGGSAQNFPLGTTEFIFSGSQVFVKGVQNINAQYMAGFQAVPPDVELACIEMCAVNVRRKGWIDQASQAMAAGAGTIRYRDWELPPRVLKVMRGYSRLAVV